MTGLTPYSLYADSPLDISSRSPTINPRSVPMKNLLLGLKNTDQKNLPTLEHMHASAKLYMTCQKRTGNEESESETEMYFFEV